MQALLQRSRLDWESAYLLLKASIETSPDSLRLLLLLVKACLLLGGERLGEAIITARCASLSLLIYAIVAT